MKKERPLKILFLTRPFPVSSNGSYVHRIGEALRQRGHEVRYGLFLRRREPHGNLEPAGADWIFPRWSIFHAWRLTRQIREINVDLINVQYVPHAYGRWGLTGGIPLLLVLLKYRNHQTVVLTLHELFVNLEWRRGHFLFGILHRIQMAALLLASSRVVVVACAQKQRLQAYLRWIPRPVEVVPLTSTVPYQSSASVPRGVRRSESASKGFLIGTLAMDYSPERISFDLNCLKNVRAHGLEASWILMGRAGDEIRRRRRALPSWVRLTGLISSSEIGRRLRAVDLMLVHFPEGPTTRNSALIAALQHGVPVVAARNPREAGSFSWRGSGVVVVEKDPRRLSEEAVRILSSPRLRRVLQYQALRFYRRHFSPEHIARQLAHVFVQCAPAWEAEP